MAQQLAIIPFSGFYNSIHDSEIDSTIERMFADRATGCERNEGLEAHIWRDCRFTDVHNAYAKEYAEQFGAEFGITSLAFESLQSPREYNFTTDRIFVHVDSEELQRIRDETDEKALRDMAREMFTSRSGFISFYGADVDEWGAVSEWDHNQLLCLLTAYANCENTNNDFDVFAELYLMESAQGNARIEQWISDATPNIKRLFKVHDYLETRRERDGE